MFKKIIYALLCILDVYFCWSAIGFTITGASVPTIIGDKKAVFMGNYILSITFGVLFIILTTLLIIFGIRLFRKRK